MFFAFFFNFFLWFNYLPCTLFSRKKKKEKRKITPFGSKLQFFCQIVIFFHKHMKNKNVVLKQVCIGEDVWACNFPWGRRLNQVFEGNFFDQVVQGRTELGVHTWHEKSSQKFLWAHFFGEVAQRKNKKKKKTKRKGLRQFLYGKGKLWLNVFIWELVNEFEVP